MKTKVFYLLTFFLFLSQSSFSDDFAGRGTKRGAFREPLRPVNRKRVNSPPKSLPVVPDMDAGTNERRSSSVVAAPVHSPVRKVETPLKGQIFRPGNVEALLFSIEPLSQEENKEATELTDEQLLQISELRDFIEDHHGKVNPKKLRRLAKGYHQMFKNFHNGVYQNGFIERLTGHKENKEKLTQTVGDDDINFIYDFIIHDKKMVMEVKTLVTRNREDVVYPFTKQLQAMSLFAKEHSLQFTVVFVADYPPMLSLHPRFATDVDEVIFISKLESSYFRYCN